MADTLGIWDFLLSLRECHAYANVTDEFLSTFQFGDRITFKLNGLRHWFTLETFNQTLGFPTDSVRIFDGDDVKNT